MTTVQITPPTCACGCGQEVGPGKRFRQGHFSRSAEHRAARAAKRRIQQPINATGVCACGCGETTPVTKHSDAGRGYNIGDHLRFVPGHHVAKAAAHHRWRGDNRDENLVLFASHRDHVSAEHRDNLSRWHYENIDASLAQKRAAAKKGAATRWAGHTATSRRRTPTP